MRDTYRPALVCAGHAIMHGKFVFSQSLSTFLSRKRVSIVVGVSGCCYFVSAKSSAAVPAIEAGLVWAFIPSRHAVTL